MWSAKDAARLYYLRRHLQLARAKGAMTVWEYLAAIEFLLDREEEGLRGAEGKVPFHYDRSSFIRQGLRVLEQHEILSPQAVDKALSIPVGLDAPKVPIMDEAPPDPVAPREVEPPPPEPDVPEPEPEDEVVTFDLLCPHCETAVPGGTLTCPACGASILTRSVSPPEEEPTPPQDEAPAEGPVDEATSPSAPRDP